jgi:hypothetical protein
MLKRMKLLPSRLLVALVPLALLAGCAGPFRIGPGGFGVEIPKEDLQKQVDKKTGFPYERSLGTIAKLRIGQAEVKLYPDENTLGLTLPASIKLGFFTIKGNIAVSTVPEYDPSEGAIYISHLTVRELQVPGVSSEVSELAAGAVTEILNLSVKRYKIYELDRKKFGEHMAKLLLKEIKVRQDGIFFRLGL